MEGISAILLYCGIGAGFAILFWLIFKFKNQILDATFEVIADAEPVANPMIEWILDQVFHDDLEKKEKYVGYVKLVFSAVVSTNKAKKEIAEKYEGTPEWEKAEFRHKIYRQYALDIANELADELGVENDGLSETIVSTIINLILGFVDGDDKKKIDAITYLPVTEKEGVGNKDGVFRNSEG